MKTVFFGSNYNLKCWISNHKSQKSIFIILIFFLGDAESLTELAKIYADKPAPVIPVASAIAAIPAGVLGVDPTAQNAAGDILCTQTIRFAKYSCDLYKNIVC